MSKRVGLVLSGGSSKCIAHLGAMQRLLEMGVDIAHVSTVSGGGLFASMVCAGLSPEKALEVAMETGSIRFFFPSTRRGGLLSMSRVQNSLEQALSVKYFDQLEIPMTVVATDILKGEPVYINQGELIKALIASASYPALFEPVNLHGRLLLDGGIIDNFPVEPLKDSGLFLLGINTGGSEPIEQVENVRQVYMRALGLAITQHDKVKEKEVDLFIEMPGLQQYGMFDVDKGHEIYLAGYDEICGREAEIKQLLGI